MLRVVAGVLVVLVAAAAGLLLSGALAGGGDGGGAGMAGASATGDAAALGSGPVGGSTDFAPAAAAADPDRGATIVARAKGGAVKVFERPRGSGSADVRTRGGAAGRPRTISRRTAEGRRLPVVLRVVQRREGWLRVELPVRPARSTGWVRARDVSLARNPFEIVIRRTDHRLLVTEHGRRVLQAPIAVGRAVSPTPRGSYFVTDLLRPPNPDGEYGPYALGLSAYSPIYTSFAGGDGQVGIHGTNDPSVIGTDVSHGCIRVANDVVRRLARLVPLGTPVEIRA
jgi:lipoprotein-anchoring transpeptidase ErfK/SrfK